MRASHLSKSNFGLSRCENLGGEMATVNLVAVQHDDHGNLLSPAMHPLIQNQVLPLLTTNSVLVVEGGKGRGKLVSDNPKYDIIYSQLGPISLSGLRPVIHSDDAMYQSQHRDILQHMQECNEYTSLVLNLLDLRRHPSTWEELIEIVKTNRHDAKMLGDISRKWKEFAVDLKKEFMERDEAFISQVQGYFEEGKDVFFFGGVLHCIALTVRRDWPVIRYPCTPENILAFYHAWFQVYGIADLVAPNR